MLKSRSYQPEIIDLGPEHYTLEEYHHCLIQLDKVGRWLGGDRATLKALNRLNPKPDSILDVGCGGGHFTARMASQFSKSKVVGIDVNPQAIAFARQHALLRPQNNLAFELRKLQFDEPKRKATMLSSPH